jgi:uncharacterized protein (TIGR02246 family)
LRRHSGHGRTCHCCDSVANDPIRTSSIVQRERGKSIVQNTIDVEAVMKSLALALCLLFGTSGIAAFAGPAEEANAVIDQWSAAYSANDRDALVSLYAPDAILLGTTSPVISEGAESIRKYFQELPGSGRKNTIVERRTIVLSETSVVATGFYNFARTTESDTPRPSRFTMVVVKRDGRWTIAHHHSSPLSASRQ